MSGVSGSLVLATPVAVSPTQVNLSWTDSFGTSVYYRVLNNGGQIGTLPAGTLTFTDFFAIAGNDNSYQIFGVGAGPSFTTLHSSNVEVVTAAAPIPITVVVNWDEGSLGGMRSPVEQFNILRADVITSNVSTTIGPYEHIASVPASLFTYADSDTIQDNNYSYIITGQGRGVSGPSMPKQVAASPISPTAPFITGITDTFTQATVAYNPSNAGPSFTIVAGDQGSGEEVGYCDLLLGAFVLDEGEIGTIQDGALLAGLTPSGVVWVQTGGFGSGQGFLTVGLIGAVGTESFTISFIDSNGSPQTFSTDAFYSHGTYTEGAYWQWQYNVAYTPFTNGVTYTINTGGGINTTYPIAGYQVSRAGTEFGSYVAVGETPANIFTFVDHLVIQGSTYWYRMQGTDTHGNESPASNLLSTTIPVQFPSATDLLALWGGFSAGNSSAVFIVGGQGTIKSTSDGSFLSNVTSGTTANLWGATNGFSRNVAVGDSGTILTQNAFVAGGAWVANNQGSSNLYDVAFLPLSSSPGTAIMAAVGAGGTILTSQAPSTGAWTINTPGNGNSVDFHGICYQPISTHLSYMYIVGVNGTVLQAGPTNATGLTYTWSRMSTGISNDLHAVASNNLASPLVVAVGANGQVLTSTNNSTWTSHILGGGTPNFHAVTYDSLNAVMRVVGDGGVEYTSPDGATWTLAASGTTNNLYGIYNNSLNAIGSPAFSAIAVGASDTIVTNAAPVVVTVTSGINSTGPFVSHPAGAYGGGDGSGWVSTTLATAGGGQSTGSASPTTLNGQALVGVFVSGAPGASSRYLGVTVHANVAQNFFNQLAFTSAGGTSTGTTLTFLTSAATQYDNTGISGYTTWRWSLTSSPTNIDNYCLGTGGSHAVSFS